MSWFLAVQPEGKSSDSSLEYEREISGEQLDLLQAETHYGLLANLVIAGVAFAALWPISPTPHLISWLAFMLVVLAVRFVLHRGYIGAARDLGNNRRWRMLVVVSCAAIGIGWGWMGLFLYPAEGAAYQLLMMMVLVLAVTTVPMVAPFLEAASAFLALAVLPPMVRLALVEGGMWGVAGALLCVLTCFVWWKLLRYHAELSQRVRLRYRQEQFDAERATYLRSVETANRLFAQVVIEREQIEAELKVARRAAEDANRAKSEFLAYTSHEIRTPLNAIIGLTRVVMDTPLTTQQCDYLRRVRNAGDRLLALINDLLDVSKIEAGKLEIEHVGFQLREVLDEVVQEQLHRCTEKNLALELEVASSVPDALIGDPLRLRQILVNLVGNAIKFTKEGRVSVRVGILQRDSDTACVLRVSVIDTGIGISPEKQATLFQRYAQAEASTSREFGGTGLGLAISKSLVELMSGAIGFHSKVDEGTEFFFDLPFRIQTAGAGARPGGLGAFETAAGRVIKVLVAEDNEDNQLLIELLLKKRNADVTIVGNGKEALEQLEQAPFDLVLMDLEMPVMGGFDAVVALREREKGTGRRVPVIALSAHALVGHRDKCLAAGMDDYLIKPIDADMLYATMEVYTGKQRTLGEGMAGTAP